MWQEKEKSDRGKKELDLVPLYIYFFVSCANQLLKVY